MDILPTVMIKNEARFIRDVLRPLVAVFGTALVADTGSTDGTLELLRDTGATVFNIGPRGAPGLTATRKLLGEEAKQRGAKYQLLCDGDELYSLQALTAVRDTPVPYGMSVGFTTMVSIEQDGTGFWELNDRFTRCAVFAADDPWGGDHPFESPKSYGDAAHYFYYPVPEGWRYHAVHLHRLARSPQDRDVWLRLQKQKQFSMRNATVPRTVPFDLAAWRSC